MRYHKRPVPSENMLTIKLAHMLMENGITFDAEYDPDWYVPKNTRRAARKNGYRGSRFDLIIVNDNHIVGIIEVKNANNGKGSGGKVQAERYSEYGVPVFLCSGYIALDAALEFSKRVFEMPILDENADVEKSNIWPSDGKIPELEAKTNRTKLFLPNPANTPKTLADALTVGLPSYQQVLRSPYATSKRKTESFQVIKVRYECRCKNCDCSIPKGIYALWRKGYGAICPIKCDAKQTDVQVSFNDAQYQTLSQYIVKEPPFPQEELDE
jgi:hypothetical protein